MTEKSTYLTFSPVVSARSDTGMPTRFSGVAYSGGVIPQYGWYGDAAIDLSTLQMPKGAVFALIDHDFSKRAGKLTAELSGGQIIVNGEFFTNEAGNEVAKLFAEGAPWQMSIGINSKTRSSDEKSAVVVNGQMLSINTLFSNAMLREVSFVPVGADPNTAVAAFSAANSPALPEPGGKPEGVNMKTIEELTADLASVTAVLESEKAARLDAEGKLAALNEAQRAVDLSALATRIGRPLTDTETQTFKAMDAGAFAIVLSAMPAAKPGLPAGLRTEQANEGRGEAGGEAGKHKPAVINMAAIYAARVTQ